MKMKSIKLKYIDENKIHYDEIVEEIDVLIDLVREHLENGAYIHAKEVCVTLTELEKVRIDLLNKIAPINTNIIDF